MTSQVAFTGQERQFIQEDPQNNIHDDDLDSESDGDSEASVNSEDEEDENKEFKVSIKSLKDLLGQILLEIGDANLDLRKGDQYTEFLNHQGPRLARKTKDAKQPTALHILAAMDTKDLPGDEQLEILVRFLVQRPENLLAERDLAGHTPLYLAISEKNDKAVKFMCQAHESIDSILSIRSHEGKNCLHLAIAQRTKLTEFLVNMAGAETLAAKDKEGNTPLHLAVEYKRCRKEQLPVIKAIVAKCDSVMRISKDGDFNNASLSPYCHHVESSRKADKEKKVKEEKEREKASGRSRPDSDRVTAKDKVQKGTKLDPPNPPVMLKTPNQDKKSEETLLRRNNMQTDILLKRDAMPGKDSMSKKHAAGQLKATTSTLPTVVTVPEFPVSDLGEERKAIRKKDSSKKKTHSKVDVNTTELIKHFLKLHYLRERGHDAALDILYGRNTASDQQIYFDLSGYDKITQSQINTTLSFLNFEEILQYVEIPKLRIDGRLNVANTKRPRGRASHDGDGEGRTDLVYVFNELRNRKVNTILKVIVDDLTEPAHSDEAIEKALDKMGVEIWDWKKTDICTEVIQTAAPKAREVHLYWSGNNAVLRGWSEEGGLKQLKELTTVYLHVQKGLESTTRTKQNVRKFRDRMQSLYNRDIVNVDESLDVLREINDINAARGNNDHQEHSPKHEWVECMKEFRQLLFDAEAYQGRDGPKIETSIEEPIQVALIDDGININQLEYNPVGGRSFCTRDRDQNLNFPYYRSSSGHGSIMASQIYRICPRTQLYVLKLEDHVSKSSTRQITSRSAAQAIRAAVRRKVHIISMSWTIDPPEDENEKRDLESAILEAAKENILMFCSAKDKGAKQTSSYPSLATNKIFKIGAAEASGAPDAWVGDLTHIDFTFPGNQVELENPSEEIAKEVVSGSSVATALAAGLAALILYCVQVRVLRVPVREKEKARKDFQELKKHDQMMKAFKSIGTTEESKNKYIAVWDLFGKLVKESEKRDRHEWIDVIKDAGVELCIKL